jgi:hypothetical protein
MSNEVQTSKYASLRFDDNAQRLVFWFSEVVAGIEMHIREGRVTIFSYGGVLPSCLVHGEQGEDPSAVVRRFANEVIYKCTENYVGPSCTTGWPGERDALVSQLGELLNGEGGSGDGANA